jgi:membrane protein
MHPGRLIHHRIAGGIRSHEGGVRRRGVREGISLVFNCIKFHNQAMFKCIPPRVKNTITLYAESLVKRFWITLDLFNANALANHAAAGAYGFLLSAAPVFLLLSLIVFQAFRSSPETAAALIGNIGPVKNFFDSEERIEAFVSNSTPSLFAMGLPGLISLLSAFWATRIFSLALQRGIGVIFAGTGKRKPLHYSIMTLGISLTVIILAVLMVFTSRPALETYRAVVPPRGLRIFTPLAAFIPLIRPLAGLGLLSYGAYRIIPPQGPSKPAAFRGALVCVILNLTASSVFRIFINPSRYSFLYGALGNLIILLGNVYFFFFFLFFGAQFAAVSDSFEALLFTRLRQIKGDALKRGQPAPDRKKLSWAAFRRRLFSSLRGPLEKYRRGFQPGDIILSQGDQSQDIYYILSGEAGIFLDLTPPDKTRQDLSSYQEPPKVMVAVAAEGHFFGEMEHILLKGRSATVAARTGMEALALPPALFDKILKLDTSMSKKIIKTLSERLRRVNEQFIPSCEGSSSPQENDPAGGF